MPIHQLSAVVATSLFGGQFKPLKKVVNFSHSLSGAATQSVTL